VDIYDCKTGEPLGSGSTGLYTNNLTLIDSYRFPYRGKYGIELMQYMRLDTLTGIQSVGLSVAKIQ
jgi:gliding motility-associated lipoprotein GldH